MTEYINVRLRTGRVVHRATVLARGNALTHCGHYVEREQETADEANCEGCTERQERIETAPAPALVG